MIFTDMANVGMFKRMDKTARNAPIKVVVSDVETLGNGDLSEPLYSSAPNVLLSVF